MNITESFKLELNNIIGKEIWGVVGGRGTGSVISLSIGDKFKTDQPSINPNLTELVKNYDSEYGLMVFSPWRIESNKKVFCGSHNNNDESGPYNYAFGKILNTTIIQATVSVPSYDLVLSLSNGNSLKVFCALIGMDDNECYALKSPQGWFSVLYDGVIEFDSGD
ncbi:MAG: hypothetical protein HRU38_02080 [Saccharospirillaceae bacterium]|nr:hypothetical protein [Pseudomonadales bacterium]NRB77448.1 hypothetical protein [Saccharospirillaceae bacterium]